MTDIFAAIDGVIRDHELADAMRWTPDPEQVAEVEEVEPDANPPVRAGCQCPPCLAR